MPLLLPNLDDRKWVDLVDDGRALLPVYGPEWTDHNASDPGITLIELLAWIAEMDIYELNQISDRERLKFLKLVGVVPKPPLPAETVLRINLTDGPALSLPAGVEFSDQSAAQSVAMRYRTVNAITLVPGTLVAMQYSNGTAFQDLTQQWRRRGVMRPFGMTPQPGSEFYLGLSAALPIDTEVQLFFTFGSETSDPSERCRILQELRATRKDCQLPPNPCAKCVNHEHVAEKECSILLEHYGVRTAWEVMSTVNGNVQWLPLRPEKDEVEDDTRAFTLDGRMTFRVPSLMASDSVGAVPDALYYLRCRFVAGSYDAAPVLQDVAFNGVSVEQSVPAGMAFVINSDATIHYSPSGPPKPNDETPLRITLDEKNQIVDLDFNGDPTGDPEFRVYDYRAPKNAAAGVLAIEGTSLGFGNGLPQQQVTIPEAPVTRSSVQLFTLEGSQWHRWKLRQDFDASGRTDFHALLEPSTGTITFGNGEKGRVPPEIRTTGTTPREQCLIFGKYETTRAVAGNLPVGAISQLAQSAHNRAVLYDRTLLQDGWANVNARLASIVNPIPASGGAAAETVALASGRADRLLETSDRAVTLADYERLAKQTPGTQIARVSARANLHPSFPCFKAPGMITVIVLPSLPQGRPMPSPGLLRTVKAYLRRRRIVGVRVEVVPPNYLEVSVQAEVRARAGANKANLQKAVVTALDRFFDPLIGGADGDGWPFGRDVYRSEVMRVIDEVPGVDYVASLALVGPDGQPQCGNVCLGPTWLVAAAAHQINVL